VILVHRLVRQHRLFAGLPEDVVQQLMAIAREQDAPKRTVLFHQGDPCEGFYMVLDGMVRLYKSSADGREHVVEVIRAGQSFAEAAVFAGADCPVTAETLEPSRLLFFPKAPYRAFLEARPQVLFGLIASLSVRMHHLVAKVERLTLCDARQRVAGFVSDLVGATPPPHTLDVSKRTMAAQLGLTPETLSRTLASLQAEGVIRLDGRRFEVIDAEALAAVSQGEPLLH
jgi:CRP-like cAMP-binding protein